MSVVARQSGQKCEVELRTTDPPGAAGSSLVDTSSGNHRSRVCVGNTWFDNVTLAEAVARIDALVRAKRPALVVTPNVDHLVRLQQDREYAALVARADLVLADGQPIVWQSRLLGTPLKERVAGSDLFPRLCEHAAATGHRVFFLGGDVGAAEAAGRALQQRFPSLQVVGTYCPPHGFEADREECRRAVEAVRAAAPDLLFIGLGSPKQERWAAQHSSALGPLVALGVGISFSFVAGFVQRAPAWMRRCGLEWFHRLCMEPRRLWKRYLTDLVRLPPIAARDLLRTYVRRGRSGS